MDFQKVLTDLNKLDQLGLVKVSNSGNFIFVSSLKNKLNLIYRNIDKTYKYEVFEEAYNNELFQTILNYDDSSEAPPCFGLLNGDDPNLKASIRSALRCDLHFLVITSSKISSKEDIQASVTDPQLGIIAIPVILLS